MSLAEPGMAELGLMSSPSPAVETCPSVGAAGQETLRLLEASPASRPSSPTDPPEPRVTTEHTNNRIGELASGGDRSRPSTLRPSPWLSSPGWAVMATVATYCYQWVWRHP